MFRVILNENFCFGIDCLIFIAEEVKSKEFKKVFVDE